MNKGLGLTLLMMAIALTIAVRTMSRSQQAALAELEAAPNRGTLVWAARKEKVKGNHRLVVPGPIADYATGIQTLDEATQYFRAIVAKPIAKTTSAYGDYEIRTWYKFKVVENLSSDPLPRCSNCSDATAEIPAEMVPLSPDEILVETYGGTIDVEGVEVTMVDREFPQFSESKLYLLFAQADPSGQIALLRMGGTGVFVVNDGALESVCGGPAVRGQSARPFVKDIESLYQNSLDQVRTRMRITRTR